MISPLLRMNAIAPSMFATAYTLSSVQHPVGATTEKWSVWKMFRQRTLPKGSFFPILPIIAHEAEKMGKRGLLFDPGSGQGFYFHPLSTQQA
ncbi:MAG: hypothetical protein MKZ95_18310 [Pirellulales bacterium]|nr:hypothetical protein [Pirellulales bacterium]